MFRKIKLESKKLLHRRKLRNRFIVKNNNKKLLPRLSVHRTCNHIYVQVIDDRTSTTITASSTLDKNIKSMLKTKSSNVEVARLIGKDIASKALNFGVENVVFDRGGYAYHGRIKALAESARENGLKF